MIDPNLVRALKGVQETLLVTMYAKGRDNRSRRSILHDELADQAVAKLEKIRPILSFSSDNALIATRALYLDNVTRDFIHRHPHAVVLNLACGLDTRVYRVDPPQTVSWYDFDFPEVAALRQQLYPERNGDHYQLLEGSVTAAGWLDRIADDAHRPVIVIAEGLFMYLTESEVRQTIEAVIGRFKGDGEIAFDSLNRLGTLTGYFHPAIFVSGARFKWGVDDPRDLERWHPQLELIVEQNFGDLPQYANYTLTTKLGWQFVRYSKRLRHMLRLLHYRF